MESAELWESAAGLALLVWEAAAKVVVIMLELVEELDLVCS